ncbi:nectin-1-like isoform X7 [Takifugu flavidus]|uniref:nectin-1-like isoform X7 n=1 Tax=Takifugu flavidus TaxID=433684 RepID=UPI0025446CF5|nr:nectin-1-like isoform X7 [Takifugu flavidus]XP_056905787.1 nectin-1-like isoform X7 [Takifugu flavidus]
MCFYRNIFIIFAVGFLMTLGTTVGAPSVVGRDVSVIQGETGVLLCSVIDTNDSVSQISWEKHTRGHPQNSEFVTITPGSGLKVINGDSDRVKFIGNIDDKNGSLELSGITLMDEGIYTCAFTLYPGGIPEKTISLNVFVPPVSSLVDNHPVLGDKEVSLATCTAAGSKPPATVSWLFGNLPGNLTTIRNAIEHHNGTVTTVSSLVGVPSRELDQQLVQCVVTSKATKDQTLPFTIQIYFPPSEVNINEQLDGSFSCDTAAKPKPEIVWTRIDGSWPESSVTVKDGRLKFLTMDASLNGLYQCEASNEYGSKYGRLYVHNKAVPPSEVNINEQPDGSFSCDTAAKPKPEIVWTRIDGSWPESSVTVKDGRLKFLTMDASLNGLYQCEASNEYGSKYGRLYVHNNAVPPSEVNESMTTRWFFFL